MGPSAKILLACGGTGGHVFPGVALAQAFEEKREDVEIVFVGTSRGIEEKILGKTKWRLEMIETPSFADRKGFWKWTALFPFLKALFLAKRLLKKERPSFVIGIGGYAAAPFLMMASLLNIPNLTIEPNAVPGLSNRVLKYFVDQVVVAYPGLEKYFGKKTRLLGVPVRRDLMEGTSEQKSLEKKVVFLFGGSQGAKKINEGILEALPYLSDLKEKIHFVHQVGSKLDPKKFKASYGKLGFSAEVYPFIEKMAPFYGRADFVIARGGANTVAELTALKKPSILIPYPFASGGHQEANARSLEKRGGAKVLLDSEVHGERLANFIREFVLRPDLLKEMSSRLAKLEGMAAADKIAEECLKKI